LNSNLNIKIFFWLTFLIVLAIEARVPLFAPDAYYYFAISGNIFNKSMVSFDMETITTGFHPLWLGVLTALHSVAKTAVSLHYLVFLIQAGFTTASVAILQRIFIWQSINDLATVFALTALITFNLNVFLLGMENTLVFLLLTVFVWLNSENIPWKRKIGLSSVILVLVYFARLDTIFLMPIYFGWQLLKTRIFSERWNFTFICGTGVAIAILVHFGIMLYFFGTIFPTSTLAIKNFLSVQEAKTILERMVFQEHFLVSWVMTISHVLIPNAVGYQGVFVNIAGLLVWLLPLISAFIACKFYKNIAEVIVILTVFCLVQMAYYAWSSNGWMRAWYYSPWFLVVIPFFTFIASSIIQFFQRHMTFVYGSIIIFSLSIVTLYGMRTACIGVFKNHECVSISYLVDQSRVLQTKFKPETVLVGFTPDRAVYFSGRSVIHIEGQVNGYEFVKNYLPDSIPTYLSKISADYFVISNRYRNPPEMPCKTLIATGRDLVAIGELRFGNSYLVFYEVVIKPKSEIERFNFSKICKIQGFPLGQS